VIRLVSLGFGCNNACIFCAQGGLRALPAEPLSPTLLDSILPGETVAFVGGEPTLEPRLPDLIRDAEARGAARIIVQTNGRRLAYRAYARELAASSKRLVLDVALQGSSEAMHEYHTATPGSFKQTAQGIRNARAEGVRSGVSTVVTRSNYRHLLDVVQLAHALGATAQHFAVVEAMGRAAQARDRLVPRAELLRPYLSKAMAEARRLGMELLVGETATPAEARLRFAGLGQVEPEPSLAAAEVAPRRLPLLGRDA
jgi:MoaA/NifB/PqqE/SkfB family radical SAM enzyme